MKAATKTRTHVALIETVNSPGATVDEEAGVIRGVKVLGVDSANGRKYPMPVIEASAPLYENSEVNVDHQDREDAERERSMRDGFGHLRNVQVRDDGLYADLHYFKAHPDAPLIVERAKRAPQTFGLSHNALGKTSEDKLVVESIERVRSVDVVRSPATTNGLFESISSNLPESPTNKGSETVKLKIKDILKRVPKGTPGKSLLEEIADEEIAGEPVAEMEAEVVADADPQAQMKAALKAAIIAAFDDESLDVNATKAKILEVLKVADQMGLMPGAPEGDAAPVAASESEGEAAAAPAPEDKKPEATVENEEEMAPVVQESIAAVRQVRKDMKVLQEQVQKLTRERDDLRLGQACRDLLESYARKVTDERIGLLKAVPTSAQRKLLVESWPEDARASRAERPASSPPRHRSGEVYDVKDAEDLASRLR